MQLLAEIKIHRCLSHRYIVGFESFFEDKLNVYIMLELCASQVRFRDRGCVSRAHNKLSCSVIGCAVEQAV